VVETEGNKQNFFCASALPTQMCATDKYRGADKSLTRPGRKQATATEDFDLVFS